jgi:HK97 family phage major capsid protein
MTTKSIAAAQAQRAAKVAEGKSITEAAEKEARTLTAEEQTKLKDVADDIKQIDAHLAALKEFEDLQEPSTPATVKAGEGAQRSAVELRGGITHQKQNDDVPGLAMARFMQSLAVTKGNHYAAAEYAKEAWKDDHRISLALKAAVAAGTTTETTWAGPLVNEYGAVAADYLAYLRPRTLIGRFGQNGIPALRRVPFRRPLLAQTSGGAGYWVGEGKPKGLTKFDFTQTNLDPAKVAAIAVITKELARDSSPSASMVVRDELTKACIERLDADFIDPAKPAVPNTSPASITNGVSAPNSNGTDEDGVKSDVQAIMATFLDANNPPSTGVWIMRPTVALALGMMTNSLGQPSFPGININGGTFQGLPVLTSNHVPAPTAGDYLILVNANDIYIADEGGFTLDMSTEASLQMDSEPSDGAASVVSLWQNNLIGFLCERTINWVKARSSAVAMIDTVNYTAGT